MPRYSDTPGIQVEEWPTTVPLVVLTPWPVRHVGAGGAAAAMPASSSEVEARVIIAKQMSVLLRAPLRAADLYDTYTLRSVSVTLLGPLQNMNLGPNQSEVIDGVRVNVTPGERRLFRVINC
jgi:hypothetical protein